MAGSVYSWASSMVHYCQDLRSAASNPLQCQICDVRVLICAHTLKRSGSRVVGFKLGVCRVDNQMFIMNKASNLREAANAKDAAISGSGCDTSTDISPSHRSAWSTPSCDVMAVCVANFAMDNLARYPLTGTETPYLHLQQASSGGPRAMQAKFKQKRRETDLLRVQ